MFIHPIRQFFVILAAATAMSPAALLSQPHQAQQSKDVVGDWQGTLEFSARAKFRLILRVVRSNDGTLSALNYSIDQSPDPMTATAVTLKGNTFQFSIPSLHGTYEGQLSADGNAISGFWKQNAPLPLNFVRATQATAWEIPAPAPPHKPMASDADPSFEIATLKPADPTNTASKFFRISGRRYVAHAVSLADLMEVAYSVHPRQITEGPSWTETDKFDLVGQPDGEGDPSIQHWITMLQKFLSERFSLTFHRARRDIPVYALTVDRDGPRNLVRSTSTSVFPSLEFRPAATGLVLPAKNASFAEFAGMMQIVVLDRPVSDQTNLPGRFDFQLTFTPDDSQFNGHPPSLPTPSATTEAAPGLFEAMHSQLGLKLSPSKAPMDVLVIDHVQKPEAN